MKKILVAGIAAFAFAFCGAPAKAAEPMFNWTGLYLGMNLGAAAATERMNNSITAPSCAPNRPCVLIVAALAAPQEIKATAFTGGMQVGYLYQVHNFVIGVENDFGYLPLRGSFQFGPTNVPGTPANAVVLGNGSVATDWLITIRARGGIAMDNKLIYLTGGIAFTNQSDVAFYAHGDPGIVAQYFFSISSLRMGRVIGAGFEQAIAAGWSIRAEYLHLDFDPALATALVTAPGRIGPSLVGSTMTSSSHLVADIVRFGINYKFGGPL